MSRTRRWLVVVAVIAAFAQFANYLAHRPDPDGITCAKGDSVQRIDACTRFLNASGTSASDRVGAFNNRAVAYAEKDQYERAVQDYDSALRMQPDYLLAIVNRAGVLVRLGKLDDALAGYNRALQLQPDEERSLRGRGQINAIRGNFDAAINDLNAALRLKPDDAGALVTRANVYMDEATQGRPGQSADQAEALIKQAIADYTLVIKNNPQLSAAFANRAVAYSVLEDSTPAMADFNQAIALNVKNGDALVARGALKFRLGQFDEARKDWSQAVQLVPDDISLGARASAYGMLSEFEQAARDLDAWIAAEPTSATAFNNRCWLRIQMGQAELGIDDCSRALSLEPDSTFIADSRGWAYLRTGRYQPALDDFNVALTRSKFTRETSLYGRSIALRQTGDTAGADADLSAARAADPNVEAELARQHVWPP